jgi:hypothetical protein
MNWGAFAGGVAQGFDLNRSLSNADKLDEMEKAARMQALRSKGMAEAEAQRSKRVSDLIKEGGTTGQPASGPIDTSTPKVETPESAAAVSASSPTANPDPAAANTAAVAMQSGSVAAPSVPDSPTANPDPAAANTAAATYPNETPAAPKPYTAWDGDPATDQPKGSVVQQTPVAKADASPTQAIVAGGTPPVVAKPSGKFTVLGKSFDTREEAQKAAEDAAPSATDLFMKNAVPKIAQQYIVNGQPDKAEAWTKYSESYNGKRAMKDWAAAYSAPDFDTAAAKFGKYYTDHINDGVDYTGHKMLTKEDGTQVAVVSLKDKKSGKETQMELTREKMLALGGANNPQHLFEQEQAKQTAAEKFKFEQAIKAQERRADFKDKSKLEQEKQDRLDQREGLKSDRDVVREGAKINAKIDAQVSSLRDAGYSDDDIKKMMPALVGAGEHKKTTDPTERRALIASDLMKNDPTFTRKSAADQNKQIDDMVGVIYKSEAPTATQSKTAAVVVDKPMPFNKDLPIKYRKSDGAPFHVVDGKYVPILGGVPGQAGSKPSAAPQPAATPATTAANGVPERVVAMPPPAQAPIQQPAPQVPVATKEQYLLERAEMGEAKRRQWSPEVKAYIEQQDRLKLQQEQARRDQEQAKAVQRSKEGIAR